MPYNLQLMKKFDNQVVQSIISDMLASLEIIKVRKAYFFRSSVYTKNIARGTTDP